MAATKAPSPDRFRKTCQDLALPCVMLARANRQHALLRSRS